MQRILISILALSSFGVLGCAEPEPSILINAHVFKTGAEIAEADKDTGICAQPKFDSCKAPGFDDKHIISSRIFADVAVRAPQVSVVMKNQLINTERLAQLGEDNNLRVDTNSIQLEKLVVTFSPTGPLKNIGDGGRVEIPLGTLLKSSGELHLAPDLVLFRDISELRKAVKSLAGVSDPNTYHAVRGHVTNKQGSFVVTSVDLQYFGKTLGGNEVESNVLTMPIELCFGCAVARTTCDPFSEVTPICIP